MALNLSLGPSPLAAVLDAIEETSAQAWLLDFAVGAGGILLGWLVARWICARVPPSKRWTFGKGEFAKVAIPLFAFLFVWGGKHVLGNSQDVAVLEILDSILLALFAVRAGAYILGHVLPEGPLHRFVMRTVYFVALLTVGLYVFGVLGNVLEWLDGIGFKYGKDKHEITLLDIVKGTVATFFAVVLALWISRISEGRVMASQSLEMTTRIVISKVIRIVVLMLVIFFVLPMAGVDITTLSIFSGAVGVGLGFGLQKIAANYISGFIILIEHSLRIGDVVTVDGRKGEVKAIETRYTLIKGADGVEAMIPNEKLIGEIVNHHTYSDPKASVVIGVTVAYDSDIEKARTLMLEAAKRHRNVIRTPPSVARVKQLTDRGVELEITVWIEDPKLSDADVRSELLVEVVNDFRGAGIEIPYPHREVRLSATPETRNSHALSRA